ncbi:MULTISPECIES: sirohydrochlorin chelatase [unclassified Ornithinimicrobium]|uniref:sirohydrochlorin chelatase n=1 Tax=unclassified Ornithinimicrobium TaxID=2615080 RepID=UPI00385234AA
MTRPLVVAAHGTASPEGQRVVVDCAARAGAVLGLDGPPPVGYVDVCGPTLPEVLAGLTDPVVVPFFLASGFHVRHDVPSAVAVLPGATVTPALGTEDEVLGALVDRVLAARRGQGPGPGPGPGAVLVLGAGSSVDAARAEVGQVARLVGERLGAPTGTAFLSGPGPRPEEELERLRSCGVDPSDVVVAAHLLSPGHFLDRAHRVAATVGAVATQPLGTHDALSDLVARRYREAVAAR